MNSKEIYDTDIKETEVYWNKFVFVHNFVRPMLTHCDYEIKDAYYTRNAESSEEYIVVEWEGGGERRINVTADSKTGMIIDIAKQLF